MLWLKIIIIIIALVVIVLSFPKLKIKFQASSQKTKDNIMLYVPLFIAILGAALLISVVR